MLLPIGLAVGSVLSLINHLAQDSDEKDQLQFKVAIGLNAKDIKAGMERSLLIGERSAHTKLGRKNAQTVRRFLQGSVSPAGSGLVFKETRALSVKGDSPIVSYVDIPGINANEIVLVVIELMAKKSTGDAAKLGLTPSLIRSLIDEKPLKTIRFVFTPETLNATQHVENLSALILEKEQQIDKAIVLKTQDEVSVSDANDWKHLTTSTDHIEITHPVLLTSATDAGISQALIDATLRATDQLRSLVLEQAN